MDCGFGTQQSHSSYADSPAGSQKPLWRDVGSLGFLVFVLFLFRRVVGISYLYFLSVRQVLGSEPRTRKPIQSLAKTNNFSRIPKTHSKQNQQRFKKPLQRFLGAGRRVGMWTAGFGAYPSHNSHSDSPAGSQTPLRMYLLFVFSENVLRERAVAFQGIVTLSESGILKPLRFRSKRNKPFSEFHTPLPNLQTFFEKQKRTQTQRPQTHVQRCSGDAHHASTDTLKRSPSHKGN